ncbi:lysophospholipid acyltransferase family protein [Lysobacter arvi]|uniref:Lysophospholipid acyltransferase family protein n=1 Tax=Lysobacter arvi TaxID=3038776 RepID=A0ABU1CFM8_9GAMM|nr:lysophospholipid acyltransferase family protein [Lysobacter arvi]MDR0183764.1 lysophospholipid acyltransferase family protein [Lysobacter arvi]
MASYAPAVRSALAAAGHYSSNLERAVLRLPSEFLADTLFLQHAPEEAILGQSIQLTGTPLDEILAIRRSGRGLLLGCSNFGCFYKSLLACRGVIDDLLIVTGAAVAPADEHLLKARLEELGRLRIRLMPVSSKSAVAIARQLKDGGVVATMLDTCLPQSQTLVAPFLGKPAVSPSGIYQLVSRFSAVVVPMYCFRRGEGVEIVLDAPIDCRSRADWEIASKVNDCIGKRILAEPDQWMMWPALLDRWHRAEAAIHST